MAELAKGFHIRPPAPEFGTPEDQALHIALVSPEIPGNTGNIGRLCAGTSMWLHLVRPLAFELDNKYLKRAGLDYWPHVKLCIHESFKDFAAIFPRERLHFFSARATARYVDVSYAPGDVLVFGCETKGLPPQVMTDYSDRLVTIPKTDKVRSLNLSNAAAIAVYEAMRQLDFSPMQQG